MLLCNFTTDASNYRITKNTVYLTVETYNSSPFNDLWLVVFTVPQRYCLPISLLMQAIYCPWRAILHTVCKNNTITVNQIYGRHFSLVTHIINVNETCHRLLVYTIVAYLLCCSSLPAMTDTFVEHMQHFSDNVHMEYFLIVYVFFQQISSKLPYHTHCGWGWRWWWGGVVAVAVAVGGGDGGGCTYQPTNGNL